MTFFIHPAESRRQFRELAESEITTADLARGALLIALEDYPRTDVARYLAELDHLVARVKRRASAGEPPIFLLGHVHAEVFDVDGYRGNSENYYDPRNAYLSDVIDRKIGLPISLSVIFLHVASAVGLDAFGVGLPGHFIVKVQFELNEVYVDPFQAGTTLTQPEIAQLLSNISNGQLRLAAEHLRAWAPRQTLIRMLANLESMWRGAGDTRKAEAARERMLILDTSPRAN
ncbi:MAG TPA: transglutaminase-like domain-containing protein [Thermoanaerobaculia bacterium]|nr:transglutaminase-like domain-containing protein [Thermoanaerobaculia bacterium]